MSENPDKKPVTLAAMLGLFVFQAAAFTVIGLAIWSLTDRPIDAFIVFDSTNAIYGTALGLALAATGWATYEAFPRFCDKMTRLQSKNFEFLSRPFPFYAIVLVSICAGVGEEALFRGGLQTLFSDYIGIHLAILVSSALFAAIHMSKPLVTLFVFGIGVFFGYIYWLTDSLLLVMIAHTVYDIFAIAALKKQLHVLGIFAEDDVRAETTTTDNHEDATDA